MGRLVFLVYTDARNACVPMYRRTIHCSLNIGIYMELESMSIIPSFCIICNKFHSTIIIETT